MSKYEIFFWAIFLAFGLNTGKYGPEKTPYLDTFLAVTLEPFSDWLFDKKQILFQDFFEKKSFLFRRIKVIVASIQSICNYLIGKNTEVYKYINHDLSTLAQFYALNNWSISFY